MNVKFKTTEEGVDFLKSHSNIVRGDDEYYYMPYWFKATDDPLVFEILRWDQLPGDLKRNIGELRDGRHDAVGKFGLDPYKQDENGN